MLCPKTRRIWHRQFILSADPRLDRWLQWWVQDKTVSSSVFNLTRYSWNKLFQEVLLALGLGPCGFTLASMRAGGATNHFRRHGNLGQLQYLGRWTSAHTMQHYLQEAFATHVSSHMSGGSLERLNILHEVNFFLDCPPRTALKRLV